MKLEICAHGRAHKVLQHLTYNVPLFPTRLSLQGGPTSLTLLYPPTRLAKECGAILHEYPSSIKLRDISRRTRSRNGRVIYCTAGPYLKVATEGNYLQEFFILFHFAPDSNFYLRILLFEGFLCFCIQLFQGFLITISFIKHNGYTLINRK